MSEEALLHRGLVVAPPERVPWLFRPVLSLVSSIVGRVPLPAQMLLHYPKGALASGLFELGAAGGSSLHGSDGARILAVVRIIVSASVGCPFCVDMNSATFRRVGLQLEELNTLLELSPKAWEKLPKRERLAALYAWYSSQTPVHLSTAFVAELRSAFAPEEIVVLANTIGMVHYWARFNQALGIPSAGFFEEECARAFP